MTIKREFLIAETEEDLRIDKLLSRRFPDRSRSRWQKFIETGAVSVSGATVKSSYRVTPGEKVEMDMTDFSESEGLIPQKISFDVIHEDRYILGINKPDSLVVHPGPGHPKGTLANGLIYRYSDLPEVPDPERPGIVHRLDMDTSGVLVVARTADAYYDLKDQFKAREVEKEYLALVDGKFDEEAGVIEAPVGRKNRDKTKMGVKLGGKKARTEFRVEREFANSTLLKVKPLTGRTHQIRVHLKYIGHRVLGDTYYGGPDYKRLMLHSRQLTLTHPKTKQWITLKAPLPDEFEELKSP